MHAHYSSSLFYQRQNKLFQYVLVVVAVPVVIFKDDVHDFATLTGIKKKKNSVALVRKRTIPTERPPLSAK
jgi:hypothetical protein